MAEDVSVSLAFDIDEGDLDTAMNQYMADFSSQLESALSNANSIHAALRDAVDPMKDLAKEAKEFTKALELARDITRQIREDAGSTRLAAGGEGGAGGGGLLGSILGSGRSGIMSMVGGAAGSLVAGAAGTGLAVAGGAAIVGGTLHHFMPQIGEAIANAAGRVFGEGARRSVIRNLEYGGTIEGSRANELLSGTPAAVSASGPGGSLGLLQTLMGGGSILDALRSVSGRDAAFTAGGAVGLMRGISGGGGMMGLFSQFAGSALGARGGYDVGASMFGPAGGAFGAAVGMEVFPSILQSSVQQGMSMYPGYLQALASMSSVGQYGGDIRQIRRLRPGSFGYGPGELGPAFSSLYQGFGGGELTSDTLHTAMAYSRAYGVDMGQIGQSVGRLMNMGGGGQGFGAGIREEIMARVMADAVSEGFGRRLPEFSQAVSSGMQVAMSGPALIGQEAMPGLTATMSRLTGLVATRHGLGLEGATRMLSPLAAAPQQGIQALMGGGDPYRAAMLWQTNRGRFGSDPYQMVFGSGGLMEAAQNPFAPESLEFQRGSLESIFREVPNQWGQALAIQQMFPGISSQGIRQVVERGGAAFSEAGGTLEGVDLLEVFTDITDTDRTESEETRDVMRDIQRSGERIMTEQLGAMRASAGFQYQQLGVAAAHASIAREFYQAQLTWARFGAQAIAASGVMNMLSRANDVFGPEMAQRMLGQTNQERMGTVFQGLLQYLNEVNPDAVRRGVEDSGRQERRLVEGEEATVVTGAFSQWKRTSAPTAPRDAHATGGAPVLHQRQGAGSSGRR